MSIRTLKTSALRILTVSVAAVIVITGLDYLACSWYCRTTAALFENAGAPVSDAVVVFFGDHTRKLELGSETVMRLNHTLMLYRSGKTANIVCTGGGGLKKLRGIAGSELMKAYLAAADVPAGSIYVDTESYDSISNWEKSLAIITAHRWKRITLVSSQLHLRRLMGIARGDSLELSYSPYPAESIGSFRDYLAQRRWIHHEWMAYAARTALPDRWYRAVIRVLRR